MRINISLSAVRETMDNEERANSQRSRVRWVFVAAIIVLYVVGIFVRHSYGPRWEITNKTGVALHDVSLGFVGWKYQQEVPLHDLAPNQVKRLFFRPCMKSSYYFNFTDSQGTRHTEQGELYITGTDSDTHTVVILPSNKVEISLPTGRLVSWESWLGFL
jgi:hypothetical protein